MTKHQLDAEVVEQMREKLTFLYGEQRGSETTQRLVERLETWLETAAKASEKQTNCTEQDIMVIAYGDHVYRDGEAPLRVLREFMNRELRGIVNRVHVLPFYPYSSDDGFSVIDYTAVDPALGEWSDVKALSDDYRVMFDFVLNHISARSAWFQGFLKGQKPYEDFFIEEHPDTDLSLIRRPRTLPLLTEFEMARGTKYVWTTFSHDQIDLNYKNPEVLLAMIDVMLEYIQKGAAALRMDAVTFLWKEVGTDSVHLPETHAVVKLFRDILDAVAPSVLIVTETNVPHFENISYFGNGRDEAHMVYNFALPPLLLHTLLVGDASVLSSWASTLKTPSDRTQFFNFTASHDGIGVQPVKGILPRPDIDWMVASVKEHGGLVNYKSLPDGTQEPYELNSTYYEALSSPADRREIADKRFLVSQAIALAMPGVPGIYLPSLFGSRNWHDGVVKTGHNRTINRQKFSIDDDLKSSELHDESSEKGAIFSRFAEMLRIRKLQPAFHPQAASEVLDFGAKVFALRRTSKDGSSLVALHNISDQTVSLSLPTAEYVDLFTSERIQPELTLEPYAIRWLNVSK